MKNRLKTFLWMVCILLLSCGIVIFAFYEEKQEDFLQMNQILQLSFIDTCNGYIYSDLNEWQKVNRRRFDLDYIGWSEGSDFMVNKSESNLYYACWRKNDSFGEIYCESKMIVRMSFLQILKFRLNYWISKNCTN